MKLFATSVLVLFALSSAQAQLTVDGPQVGYVLEEIDSKEVQELVPGYGDVHFSRDAGPAVFDYTQLRPRHYGIFCELEARFDRRSRFAPRFRLGGADLVDYLEGKRSY